MKEALHKKNEKEGKGKQAATLLKKIVSYQKTKGQ
jgi:hypothetical protein